MSCSDDGTADHDDSDWLSEMETSESELDTEDEPCSSSDHDSEDARIVLKAPSTPPCRVPWAPRAHAPADSEDEADGETLGSHDTPTDERADEQEEEEDEEDDASFISDSEDLPADVLEHVLSAIRRRQVALLSLP